jgi:hypothetical protein
LVFHAYINEMHGSRSKIPSKKFRPYIYAKFLALLVAPYIYIYIYDISRLRVKGLYPDSGMSTRNYVDLVCAGSSRIRPVRQAHIVTVLTAEGRWVHILTRKRRSLRHIGIGMHLLSQKKARHTNPRLKHISLQGVTSSRHFFNSAALHSGPTACVEGVTR